MKNNSKPKVSYNVVGLKSTKSSNGSKGRPNTQSWEPPRFNRK